MAEILLKCLLIGILATIKAKPTVAQTYPPPLGSPPFQCQPSRDQDGQFYTPNIPESYFLGENAAYYMATNQENVLDEDSTYIYTIPAESAERDCGGIATALEYCYKTNISSKGLRINVFNFLVLSQDGQQFTIRDRFRVRSTPETSMCTSISTFVMFEEHPQDVALVCCDRFTISRSRQFEVTQSPVTIGVLGRTKAQLLAIPLQTGDRSEMYRLTLMNSGNIGFSFMATSSDLWTLPMLRISLDPSLVTTANPTTASPTEPESTSSLQVNITTSETEVENEPTVDNSSPTESESAHGMTTRALVGAVLAGIVVVLAIMLLMIWLVVSKRKANRKRLQKRKAPQVPPQPKPCQNFTITRNEAYRVPATSYEEDSAHNPYYIMPQEYTVPTLGKTHSIIQSETLLDSYEYVIPSRI